MIYLISWMEKKYKKFRHQEAQIKSQLHCVSYTAATPKAHRHDAKVEEAHCAQML